MLWVFFYKCLLEKRIYGYQVFSITIEKREHFCMPAETDERKRMKLCIFTLSHQKCAGTIGHPEKNFITVIL